MSAAMRSPMRDRSTRYPKVSRPWERSQDLRGARAVPLAAPRPSLLLYLEAVKDEQVGAEVPGLSQEAAHVVPRVLGHDLHQLTQKQGDLHIHQCCAQCQLGGWETDVYRGTTLFPNPWPFVSHYCPHFGGSCVSRRVKAQLPAPGDPWTLFTQLPCAGSPGDPQPRCFPRSPLRFGQAGKLSLGGSGGGFREPLAGLFPVPGVGRGGRRPHHDGCPQDQQMGA